MSGSGARPGPISLGTFKGEIELLEKQLGSSLPQPVAIKPTGEHPTRQQATGSEKKGRLECPITLIVHLQHSNDTQTLMSRCVSLFVFFNSRGRLNYEQSSLLKLETRNQTSDDEVINHAHCQEVSPFEGWTSQQRDYMATFEWMLVEVIFIAHSNFRTTDDVYTSPFDARTMRVILRQKSYRMEDPAFELIAQTATLSAE